MTDISIAPQIDGEQASDIAGNPSFYVVSRRKLTILFIFTMGGYGIYWFYKNWSQYRKNGPVSDLDRASIWPVPRGIFSIFFVHSLFNKVKALGQDKPQVAAWRNNMDAWWIVALYVAVNVADRLAKRSIGSPLTDLFGFLGIFVLLFPFLHAQTMINASCNDPQGKHNNTLTGANYFWIVLGALVWIGAFVGGFMSGASNEYSSGTSF